MDRIAVLTDLSDLELGAAVEDLAAFLRRAGVDVVGWPRDAELTLVWSDRAPGDELEESLAELLRAGSPVLLAGPTLAAWRDAAGLTEVAGLLPGRETPTHEIRVRPGPDAGEVATRMGGELVVTDRWLLLDKVADDVDVLLTASMGLVEQPVCTLRDGLGVLTVGSAPATVRDPAYQRLVLRWIRRAIGRHDGPPVRVGLLGYGAIGHEHNAAIATVDGLVLSGVCDRDPLRVEAARALAPALRAHETPEDLLAADDVDLVVVSTPPNTHAEWALRVLAAGKHCVVEKPFSLTVAEADDMIAAAEERDRVLAVYQNRRWDPDYLVLKRAVRAGLVGEVFHYESFVGGYGHPCNYWHSDTEVSGGAIYDWGSHYLDWVLDLLPQPVEHVTAAVHKRVWHDVTNADHSRVTLRFVDGVEAEFVQSDIAAALKPKWYVLGTRGALVGSWRHERVVARNDVGLLEEDLLAAADSPARVSLHAADGSVTELAVPPAPVAAFHRELADRLLSGVPMSVSPAGSRRNIAVMEAATVSARDGGRPVKPADR